MNSHINELSDVDNLDAHIEVTYAGIFAHMRLHDANAGDRISRTIQTINERNY